LQETIDLALRLNPDVKTARIQRTMDKYSLVVAKNEFEFQYSLTGSAGITQSIADGNHNAWQARYNVIPGVNYKTAYGTQLSLEMNNSIADTYNPSLTFKVMQPLMKGFGPAVVQAALENAYTNDKVSSLSLKTTIINTVTQVINDFNKVAATKRNLDVQVSNLNRKIETRDQTLAKINAGELAQTNLIQSEADLSNAQAAVERARNQLSSDTLSLLSEIGLDSEANIEIVPDTPMTKFTLPTLEKAKTLAVDNNIGYLASELAIESTKRSVLTAEDGRRWQLNLSAAQTVGGGVGSGQNANLSSLSNGANMNSSISLDLTIPIDDVSAKQSEINAKGALEQATILLKQSKRQLEISITQKVYALESEKKEVSLNEQSVDYHLQDVENAKKLYKAGRLSQFELSNRQDNLTTAQQQLLESRYQYFGDLVALDAMLSHTLVTWGISMDEDQ